MATTQRFGLNKFGGSLGGSIADDSGKFSSTDRDTIDRVLASLEVHSHVGGTRLADPAAAPTAVVATGGSLPAGKTFYYKISYLDRNGLETAGSAEVSVSTPTPVQPPSAPVITTSSGGALTPGLYYWAGTSVVGSVETPLGNTALFTIDATNGTVNLDFGSLPTGADHIGVWRQGPADSGFTKIGTVAGSTFVDNGSVPSDACACDPTHLPPSQNLTGATSKVTVTVPSADTTAVHALGGAISRWRIYRSEQSGVYPDSAIVHEVVETSDGTPATGLVTTWDDLGTVPLMPGRPLAASITLTPSVDVLQRLNAYFAATPDSLFVGTITRDSSNAPTAATVVWPDGVSGTYAGTASATFPGAIDSYTVTHGSRTYTQPTVTRNSAGAITNRPAITVS